MITLADTEERSFRKLTELKDFLASRRSRVFQVPLSELSLDEKGMLCPDRFKGLLADSGFKGLLNMHRIPEQFAREVCPRDWVCATVQRLSKGNHKPARVKIVDDIVTAVMPSDRKPIDNELLLDWLGNRSIQEATISGGRLRITSLTQEPKELLPGDAFGSGWELVNDEDGWHPTEAQQYLMRLVCENGQIGFDRTASFHRSPRSRESVAESLEKLSVFFENMGEVKKLAEGVKWAAEQEIGDQRDDVVEYLARRLDGASTRLALDPVKAYSSWYMLLNSITSSARLHQLDMRRRYELEGGRLLNWYRGQGRGRAPWRPASCEQCKYLLASESQN